MKTIITLKTIYRHYKKKKDVQADILDEHRFKDPEQNTNESNTTIQQHNIIL